MCWAPSRIQNSNFQEIMRMAVAYSQVKASWPKCWPRICIQNRASIQEPTAGTSRPRFRNRWMIKFKILSRSGRVCCRWAKQVQLWTLKAWYTWTSKHRRRISFKSRTWSGWRSIGDYIAQIRPHSSLEKQGRFQKLRRSANKPLPERLFHSWIQKVMLKIRQPWSKLK